MQLREMQEASNGSRGTPSRSRGCGGCRQMQVGAGDPTPGGSGVCAKDGEMRDRTEGLSRTTVGQASWLRGGWREGGWR